MANPIKASDLYQDDGAIKKAIKDLEELSEIYTKLIDQIKKEAKGLEKGLQGLTDSTEEYNDEVKETSTKVTALEKEFDKYVNALSDTNKKIQALRQGTNQLNRVSRLEAKLAASKTGSYNKLSAQYSLNKIRLNQMSKAQRENTVEGRNLVKQSKEIYEEMKRLQEETGKTALNVGNYKESIKEALEEIDPFGLGLGDIIGNLKRKQTAIKGVIKSLGGANKSLRLFRLALIGTGIGAILVALASLVAFLTKSQKGIDFLNRKLAQVRAVADVFIDRLAKIGEALTTDFVGTLRKAGGAVVGFFGKLIKQDYAGLALDIATVGNGIKDLGKEMAEEARIAGELAGQLQSVRDRTQTLEVTTRQTRAEIKKFNLIAEDTTRAFNERAEAAEAAGALERGLLNERAKLLEEEINILERQGKLSNNLFEDDQALADKRIELAQVQEESLELQTTLNNKLNTINDQAATSAKKLTDELAEAAAKLGGPAAEAILKYERAKASIIELREEAKLLGKDFDFSSLQTLADAEFVRDMDRAKGLFEIETLESLSDNLEEARVSSVKFAQEVPKALLKSVPPGQKSIFDALKIDEDDFKQVLSDSLSFAVKELNNFLAHRKAITDQLVANADREVGSAENALSIQTQLQSEGLANTANTARTQLLIAQRNQARALKEQEKAGRDQRRLESLQQASSLVTASAKIWGQLGFPLAIPAIAFMWGSFIASKVRASQLASDNFREGGFEILKGGSHQSGRDVSLGIGRNGRERRAEGGEGLAIISKASMRRYGPQVSEVIHAINTGTFEAMYSKISRAGTGMLVSNTVASTDTSVMEGHLGAIRRQGERQTTTDEKGRKVVTYRNLKQVYV